MSAGQRRWKVCTRLSPARSTAKHHYCFVEAPMCGAILSPHKKIAPRSDAPTKNYIYVLTYPLALRHATRHKRQPFNFTW